MNKPRNSGRSVGESAASAATNILLALRKFTINVDIVTFAASYRQPPIMSQTQTAHEDPIVNDDPKEDDNSKKENKRRPPSMMTTLRSL